MAKKIEIELVRSPICTPQWMRVIVKTLALRRIRHKRVLPDTPSIRGMVKKVSHLVSLKEVEG